MDKLAIKTVTAIIPKCYAYTTPEVRTHDGWTKIGFTEREVKTRIKEQTHTVGVEAKIHWERQAVYVAPPYGSFTDREFHTYLKKLDVERKTGTEWFRIDPDTAERQFTEFTKNHGILGVDEAEPPSPYTLREEQENAVRKAMAYYESHEKGEFLWNAKPRFGKTLASYDLCLRLGAKNILIVTNRPAIAHSWYDDYEHFLGVQSGYAFVSETEGIKDRSFVVSRKEYVAQLDGGSVQGCIGFVSLQDLKGSLYFGGGYDKLKWISELTWDILIIDEAHEGVDTWKTDTAFENITRKRTLHLSGTPFKALANDKFAEAAIYNWTYADEQRMKRDWDTSQETENPYAKLPKLSLFTYQMSELVRERVQEGFVTKDGDIEAYAFDLNEFFKTNESGKFIHDAEVDRFLDALTCQGKFPFSTDELRDQLKHTFWMLNRVKSAEALANKLKNHPVFKDYEIVLAAGNGKLNEEDETGKALDRVREAIEKHDKTITLSVGQLTTGVTVPEWSAVLMLSNMSSPALYMQAAFRAQNPCLFQGPNNTYYRKENAYVFDFDPARTLNIVEQFANDLIPETSGTNKSDTDSRKQNVRELLNFFPVYAEDEEGMMTELDAEAVLTIPRKIHAREVVERGFMSNFLFANISGIFGAPKEIIDLINGMQAVEEPKALAPVDVDGQTAGNLGLGADGEVHVPKTVVVGLATDLFGEKIYGDVGERLEKTVDKVLTGNPKKDELKNLKDNFAKPMADTLVEASKARYGKNLTKSTQSQLERKIRQKTDKVVERKYGAYLIQKNQLEKEKKEKIAQARKDGVSESKISAISNEYEEKESTCRSDMVKDIAEELQKDETICEVAEEVVNSLETDRLKGQKDSIEDGVRDHLRGFSRTIPAFLMAYGDENTTLANFDSLVPPEVFWEVTVNPQNGRGVTLEEFRLLRDGGDYFEKDENGNEIRDEAHRKYFDGHLFDEVVFNDAVAEFIKKRTELADYFSEAHERDIFTYIPPQKTNQIFTPKEVVIKMVDRLEEENPGCFDDPNATFADLYMKSGMYLAEIVKRLYRSEMMKKLYPDEAQRLNHIFGKQIYGCAPTEIIYRICLRYLLGFSEHIKIEKHNIKLFDTLQPAQDGTAEEALKQLFEMP